MTTTSRLGKSPQKAAASPWTRDRVAKTALSVLLAGFLIAFLLSLRKPPQMGPDERVFNTVDALYTAVRNRDEARTLQCQQRFAEYRRTGQLPDAAANYLDDVIATARGGQWRPAAERLYDFMLAQRRDGLETAEAHPPRRKAKK